MVLDYLVYCICIRWTYLHTYAYIWTEGGKGPKSPDNFPGPFEPSCFTLNEEQGGWGGLGLQVWQERERQGYEEAR